MSNRLNLTGQDLVTLKKRGIEPEEIVRQVSIISRGCAPLKIVAPATIDNKAIKVVKDNDLDHYSDIYNKFKDKRKIYKFVPASGAATRMFKRLYEFLDGDDLRPREKDVMTFFEKIDKFPFYRDLNEVTNRVYSKSPEELISAGMYKELVKLLLFEEGLNYSALPKALLKFHRYPDGERTAMEEQVVESFMYAVNSHGVNIHFTVSPEHREEFESLSQKLKERYKPVTGVLNIEFSEQNPATDTVALDEDGNLLRDENGEIVFRPGGHGALIYNLNDLDADFVFIKNIDNVAPDRLKYDTETYMRALAGYMFTLKNRMDGFLEMLDLGATDKDLDNIFDFITHSLNIKPKLDLDKASRDEKIDFARKILNRPLRVAGMVRRSGDPGGGPYLVESEDYISPQIVEDSQVDLTDPFIKDVLEQSTHFNPVLIVACFKDYKGKKFDLLNFVDHEASLVTYKTYKGKKIKILERPGLWNGAMAKWNTVFVQVPATTFNPVKTVLDLLKPNHQ